MHLNLIAADLLPFADQSWPSLADLDVRTAIVQAAETITYIDPLGRKHILKSRHGVPSRPIRSKR